MMRGALAISALLVCATVNAKGTKMTDLRHAFDGRDTPVRLGHPGGTVRSVSEYLPGVAWVVIDSPDGGEGRPVVVEDGHFNPAHDPKLAAKVLHRLIAQPIKLDADRVAVVLEKFAAMPSGFSSSQLHSADPASGEHGGLTLNPFRLVLISSNWSPSPVVTDGPAPPPGLPVEGIAPRRSARAILHLEDSRFVWSIETFAPSDRSWSVASRMPIE
ncbi:MAG TPA: hypothetical protein VJ891_09430 [Casimicrobiaceae bacterium]|nr:hypothetical protein [Casimicrobiaceae bacterium]